MRIGAHSPVIAIAPGKAGRSAACNPLAAPASPLQAAVAAASRLAAAVVRPVVVAAVPEAAEPDVLPEAAVAAAHARPVAAGSAAAVGLGVRQRAARAHEPRAAEAQVSV